MHPSFKQKIQTGPPYSLCPYYSRVFRFVNKISENYFYNFLNLFTFTSNKCFSERIFDKACPEEYDDLMKDTITVSRAQEKDLARIMQLLQQVNHVHASIRPDLFADGERKICRVKSIQ